MFQRIEAHGYRCLRSVHQSINPFEILIGSNASGKSTFLDVIAFLGDMVSGGLEAAVEKRTANFHDLVWGRDTDAFELAVEAAIPEDRRVEAPAHGKANSIRYEIGIRLDTSSEKLHIAKESVTLGYDRAEQGTPHAIFNVLDRTNVVVCHDEAGRWRFERNDLHRNYTSLSSLLSDADFPASAWLRELLRAGITPIALDLEQLRKPSPPATSDRLDSRGSYMVRSIARLKSRHTGEFNAWLDHVRTVLPDIKDLKTVIDENHHRRLVIDYQNNISVPSWMVSDGTLRLLALTVLAYAPDFRGVYLIEEPENGVHPAALQAIYESLSSVYDGQVLVASHSPVLLSMAKPEQLLCFIKTPEGTRIVRGSEHQALRDWQGEVSLGMLAASGILG